MRDGDVTETKVANIFTLLRKQVLHCTYSKTWLKRPLKKKTKTCFETDYHFMQVISIAECSKESCSAILSTFIKLPFVIKILICFVYFWMAA